MKRVGAVALTALLALAVPATAQAAPEDPLDRFERVDGGQISSDFVPVSADGEAKVTVMVELASDPVAVVDAASTRPLTKAERDSLKAQRKAEQDQLKPALSKLGAQVRSQVQSAYNGIKVSVARKDLPALEALPGVKAVQRVQTHEPTTLTSVPYLGVDQVWQDNGYTGAGVKVAIIDTGIDYTHATFGGPGTPEAFAAASATNTTNRAWIGDAAPRVKGGWDFVGDSYNASDPANSTPKPDANPIDCSGHGTHVAGTTGGGGVTEDGMPYTGPYDATTFGNTFRVGPGVAPEVDLYALKVFGCQGSTDLTVEAIDWAVEAGMDVINMSLGSDYGTVDDPASVAASNAAAKGIVVVASAGNAGPNPYLAGSPGAGNGVISVAANDSTATFPGANLTLGGETINAINANDADLAVGPYDVVVLTDDPDTEAANEALGCAVSDYTDAGISAAASTPQIAVTTRGDCARVARAAYGQQAGADAVVMINDSDTLPPFEGTITEVPDVNGGPSEEFLVTIPFLGVTSSDGPLLVGADGQSLSMTAKDLANPGFERYASFSSGGPRMGDSALRPSVTAPGVSISSAAVGTGSGALILSGTSMAAPHVAGVAALGVQAHPDWSGQDVSAALVSTADPAEVAGYRLTLGGGLVDPAGLVNAEIFAYGDSAKGRGAFRESTLSFGFAEVARDFTATRTVTLVNRSASARTYTVGYEKTAESLPAKVTFNRKSVAVPAGGTATVRVTLAVKATDVPASVGATQANLAEVSGTVVLTSSADTLRVGALLVPRPSTKVSATVSGSLNGPQTQATLAVSNMGAVTGGVADVYTWGHEDRKDQRLGGGFDLQAAGVQSFRVPRVDLDGAPEDDLLVFAVSTHDRYSNAASIEFDIPIDTDGDGADDVVLFSYDAGAILTGDHNGDNWVFIYDLETGAISFSGFAAGSPTNSSTVLLPVFAGDLGIEGAFSYTVVSFNGDAFDQFPGWATYNATAKPFNDGGYVEVAAGGKASVPVTKDPAAFSALKPLGLMAVSYDNPAGKEASLIRVK